jgi:hypothetical protein
MRRIFLFLGITLGVALVLAEHRRSSNRSAWPARSSRPSPPRIATEDAEPDTSPPKLYAHRAGGRSDVRTSDPELTGLPRQALFEIGRDLGIDLRDLIVMRSDQLIGAIREVGTPRPSGADPSI